MRREVKPQTKDLLIYGIKRFWHGIDEERCKKYIVYLRKFITKVIEVNGDATGY